MGLLDLGQILAIALGLHPVLGNEPQRRRVDAIAQPALILRPIREDMAQMAVAMLGPHLDADHAVADVAMFGHVVRDGLGEGRPAAARIVLRVADEQRLARHDIDIDACIEMVVVFAGKGTLGAILLCHAILLRCQPGDRIGGFLIGHLVLHGWDGSIPYMGTTPPVRKGHRRETASFAA